MPTLEEIRTAFTEGVGPQRARVRAGELSQRDFAPLLEEAFARAERSAEASDIERWQLCRAILGDTTMHWADRRVAVNRLHDPALVPEPAAAEIAPVIETVLRDPATRYNLMLHTVMAAGILRDYRPASALYPVSRATIDEAVVPYVEHGLPGEEGFEEQMRNLRHSMHLLATVARLAMIHREGAGEEERGAYEPLLASQLDRVLALARANREAMVAPEVLAAGADGPGAREIDFEPTHIMEHLAEAMEEVGRGGDARLIRLLTEHDVPAAFEEMDVLRGAVGRTPSRLAKYRAQAASFGAAASR